MGLGEMVAGSHVEELIGKLRALASRYAGPVADVGAGATSVIGRAVNDPAVAAATGLGDKAMAAGRALASNILGDIKVPAGTPGHDLPHHILTGIEQAAKADAPTPGQRAVKGLLDIAEMTPADNAARRTAAIEAASAERAAADTRRNLLLAGLGGLGVAGTLSMLNRHSEDPDTYKHSSELGWRPRQKTAAPFDFSPEQAARAAADTAAFRAGQEQPMLRGYDMSARATPGHLNSVRMGGQAAAPTTGPVGVDPMGMFGSQAGRSMGLMQRGDVVPRARLRLPEMQLGGSAVASAPNPFENTPLPRTPVRLPEMQLGGRAQAPRRAQFAGLSDDAAIAAARNAAQFGNFGNARLAAGSREGTRQFTADQARQFLARNPLAASNALRSGGGAGFANMAMGPGGIGSPSMPAQTMASRAPMQVPGYAPRRPNR
jgi:hypothetical protein